MWREGYELNFTPLPPSKPDGQEVFGVCGRGMKNDGYIFSLSDICFFRFYCIFVASIFRVNNTAVEPAIVFMVGIVMPVRDSSIWWFRTPIGSVNALSISLPYGSKD